MRSSRYREVFGAAGLTLGLIVFLIAALVGRDDAPLSGGFVGLIAMIVILGAASPVLNLVLYGTSFRRHRALRRRLGPDSPLMLARRGRRNAALLLKMGATVGIARRGPADGLISIRVTKSGVDFWAGRDTDEPTWHIPVARITGYIASAEITGSGRNRVKAATLVISLDTDGMLLYWPVRTVAGVFVAELDRNGLVRVLARAVA